MLVSYMDNRLGDMLLSVSPNKHIRMYNKIIIKITLLNILIQILILIIIKR
nr:MAG TPA: hypothetical protein [Caudoviricetes sp.]